MTKYLLTFIILLLFSTTSYSQTDTEIARSLVGQKYYSIIPTLDSLGLYYYFHYPEKLKSEQKVVSIANGAGTVKLFSFYLNDRGDIDKIVINYRHDSREQLEDLKKITNPDDKHVGKYSTDITFSD